MSATSSAKSERPRHYTHRSLLEDHSEYFKKALNGPWKEAQEGVVTLEDVECDTFCIFVDWLYTQRLPRINKEWRLGRSIDYEKLGEAQVARLKSFIFADRIISPPFH